VRWIRCADAEINDNLVPAGLELPTCRCCRTTSGTGADGCSRPWEGNPGSEPGLQPWQARLVCRWAAQEILGTPARSAPCPLG
jgi:hypothetical protein